MKRSRIFYLEDHAGQRVGLKRALELREFAVEVAANADEAREKLARRQDEFDVVVLDMRLDDTPEVTGADVAIEFYNPQTEWPPEFLILSAFSETDYFKLALQLGAAAYLQKPQGGYDETIRHIRSLVLRRALSAERPDVAEHIQEIVESSRNRLEAVERYCHEVMVENFRANLGAPFLILLTTGGETRCCAAEIELPDRLPIYHQIQSVVFAQRAQDDPYQLDPDKFSSLSNTQEREIVESLKGTAFLPLSIARDLTISLGILPADPKEMPLAEDPVKMVKVLSQYFQSAVLSLFLNILTRWADQETKRREQIRATSQFCTSIGQEQDAILKNAYMGNDVLSNSDAAKELIALAGDLRATGAMLDALSIKQTSLKNRLPAVVMAQFMCNVWQELKEQVPLEGQLEVQGDCTVHIEMDDLRTIIVRLLQWFAQRFACAPAEQKPEIIVRCAERDRQAEIVFEDRSWRLDKALRDRLFDPFAETVTMFLDAPQTQPPLPGLYLPLYLAKMLIEVRYQGTLQDATDGIGDLRPPITLDNEQEQIGNRLVIRFPLREGQPINA